jgi:hypothetical protein
VNTLLKLATDAHGGVDRWNHLESLEAELSVTGAIWHVKRRPDVLKDIRIELPLHEERLTTHFVGANKRFIFSPSEVRIEDEGGDGDRVRLYSRPGNDMTRRFPLIAEALTGLRSRSCIIDGEAVACDDNGLASFERIRYRQHDGDVFLYAFDLIELNGDDLRRDPLQVRKATLASILALAGMRSGKLA